jgi:hypothetical protein
MAPNSHPHVAILIVMVERISGTVENCLQRHLSKTRLIMQLKLIKIDATKAIIYSPYEQEGLR